MLRAAVTLGLVLAGCSAEGPPPGTGGGGAGGGGGTTTTTTSTSMGGADELPPTFIVEGVVVDPDGAPIADAIVLQGGRSYEPPHFTTGADGTFSLELYSSGYGKPSVVAAKPEHRAAALELIELPTGPIEIVLHRADPPDNPAYVYGEPGDGDDPSTKYCGHCHESYAAEFQTSKHARATDNPLVQDLYAGVSQLFADAPSCAAAGGQWKPGLVPGTASDAVDKCYLGGGVLPDLNTACGGAAEPACDDPAITSPNAPSAFGGCADCHAPGIDGVAGGRDLHDAVGIAFDNGVHCDVCHKVKDVDLSQPPGIGRRLVLQRPREPSMSPLNDFRPIYFGPLLDVPNAIMGGSYQPKFDEAVFCAGCHQQHQLALVPGDTLDPARWPDGLPVHTTYDEWLAGPYNSPDTPCQFCHMPERYDGLVNSIDTATADNLSVTFGFARPPEDNRRHIFRSPLLHGTPRLIDSALYLSVGLALNSGAIDATVSLANIGCGHALPTGEPMRALVLSLTARGVGCNEVFPPVGGMTIHDTGGSRARGIEGQDVATSGAVMTWAAGAQTAAAGQVVRVVRPTGVFDDYTGVGFFADPLLTPAEKGLEIHAPVGEALVLSAGSGQIQLDLAIVVQPGDIVYLGDALGTASDGMASLRLAGAAGYSFAKVLTDAASSRGVPHYRAIDIASDNRIPPGDNAVTSHSFSVVAGCTSAVVDAVVLYRPIPTALAALRGWDARDYVIATAQANIALP